MVVNKLFSDCHRHGKKNLEYQAMLVQSNGLSKADDWLPQELIISKRETYTRGLNQQQLRS